MNSNMDSNLIESTLNSINQLVGRIQYLEQQIDYLQASNASLQAAYANLSTYNNYLCSLVSSPDPDTVPTVFEDEGRPNKRLREESSDELRVEPLEQSFIGNSDGSASGEETNSLLEDYRSEESDDFLVSVRNLFEKNPLEEDPFEEEPLENPFWENPLENLFRENSSENLFGEKSF